MDHINVDSSIVRSIGYDPRTRTLEVSFKSSSYKYLNVSQADYDALMASDSIGAHFVSYIKGKFPTEKLS